MCRKRNGKLHPASYSPHLLFRKNGKKFSFPASLPLRIIDERDFFPLSCPCPCPRPKDLFLPFFSVGAQKKFPPSHTRSTLWAEEEGEEKDRKQRRTLFSTFAGSSFFPPPPRAVSLLGQLCKTLGARRGGPGGNTFTSIGGGVHACTYVRFWDIG